MSEATTETDENNVDHLLQKYDANRGLFADCTTKVEGLIKTILESEGIAVHSVESRVKDRESYSRKVNKTPGKYSDISEITDLSGIRIITYFHDEVDKVAEIVAREFSIDSENSVDKRNSPAPDSFGYLSLHYIASFLPTRFQLTEYARFKEVKFEIQIRSILQHAWAEIEHDLGYKSKSALPNEIKRRFSRLAGLLEIGDSEFAQIRNAIDNYKSEVSTNISNTPKSVIIDEVTLELFIRESDSLAKLDTTMVSGRNGFDQNKLVNVEFAVSMLKYLGLDNISDVENAVVANAEKIVNFHQKGIKNKMLIGEVFYRGFSLIVMCYVLLYEKGGELAIIDAVSKSGMADGAKLIASYATRVLKAS